jgi:Ca-activated chloride channel family protein
LLWLLLLVPIVAVIIYIIHKKRRTTLTISTTQAVRYIPLSWKVKFRPLVPILQLASLALMIIGLARLQKVNIQEYIETEGIDIVISMDISGSMLAEDFKPNRLEAAKETAKNFIKDRVGDRVGLVIFSGESFTQCPITIDHNVVRQQIDLITNGMLEDGTAIGMGLATGVDRLKDAKGKSKILILLTDGVNNTGKIDPSIALELAKAYDVKVYTIGIGTMGKALFPVQTPLGVKKELVEVEIDEPLLKQIAEETGGKYFRATDNNKLSKIYEQIDRLEKSKVELQVYAEHKDMFQYFIILSLACILLATILQFTIFKKLP